MAARGETVFSIYHLVSCGPMLVYILAVLGGLGGDVGGTGRNRVWKWNMDNTHQEYMDIYL